MNGGKVTGGASKKGAARKKNFTSSPEKPCEFSCMKRNEIGGQGKKEWWV